MYPFVRSHRTLLPLSGVSLLFDRELEAGCKQTVEYMDHMGR